MALSDIIRVTVSIESASIVAAGFGVPAIFGVHTRFAERYREYTDPSEMLADGFIVGDAEYKAAVALMSQEKHPALFVVARRLTPVAQVATITVSTVTDSAVYTFSLNGRAVTYTADGSATAAEIVAGLKAAADALSPAEPVTITTASPDVIITATVAGVPLTVTEADSKLSLAQTTASVGIEDDLAAVRAAGAAWYGTLLTTRDDAVAYRAAVWTEGNSATVPSILIAQTSTAAVRTSVYDVAGTDLGDKLKAGSFRRTALLWHSLDTEYLDAAFAGRLLPEDPGVETWALKDLSGVTVDTHTATQKANLTGSTTGAGKNVNIYYAMTSSAFVTWRGTMSSGDWIDMIRFIDFLVARMSENIAGMMLSATKVPFTDDGIQGIAAQVRGVLQAAEEAGKLAKSPKYVVTAPRAADISTTNRRNRVLSPAISFSAQASGAIHEASVEGKITQ